LDKQQELATRNKLFWAKHQEILIIVISLVYNTIVPYLKLPYSVLPKSSDQEKQNFGILQEIRDWGLGHQWLMRTHVMSKASANKLTSDSFLQQNTDESQSNKRKQLFNAVHLKINALLPNQTA
jgi:hypothetical protein